MGARFSALGPSQPPIQWVPGLYRGQSVPPSSSAEVKEKIELYLYSPLWAFVSCYRVTFTFNFYLRKRTGPSVTQTKRLTPCREIICDLNPRACRLCTVRTTHAASCINRHTNTVQLDTPEVRGSARVPEVFPSALPSVARRRV